MNNAEAARRRTRDTNSGTRRTEERSRRAPDQRTTAERQKRAPNDRPRGKPTNIPVIDAKKANKMRDLEKGELVAEKNPSKPDPSTVSNSSSESEAKIGQPKSWFSFPKLSLGRDK